MKSVLCYLIELKWNVIVWFRGENLKLFNSNDSTVQTIMCRCWCYRSSATQRCRTKESVSRSTCQSLSENPFGFSERWIYRGGTWWITWSSWGDVRVMDISRVNRNQNRFFCLPQQHQNRFRTAQINERCGARTKLGRRRRRRALKAGVDQAVLDQLTSEERKV